MNDKINGFVLSMSDYKEADSLMQVLTKEYGIISLVGKASKKLDSKNHFLPMCLYEFIIDYKDGKTIYSVHGYKLLNNYFEDKDIEMMSLKNILVEVTLKNKDISTYDQLTFVFSNLNKQNRFLLSSMYFSYLIKRFGISPVVDECVVCGSKKVVAISNNQGGFLCEKHLNGETSLPVDMLKKFRLIIKAQFDNYDSIKDIVFDLNDFYLAVNFYIENAYLKLKSYDFYKSLN